MTTRIHGVGSVILLSVVSVAVFVGAVFAQGAREQAQSASGAATSAMKLPETGMMAERKKMMADAQAAEKRLDELVAKMNASQGTAKIDQIAAVVNELVAQHKRMREGMMSMPGGMMQRMQAAPQPKEGDVRENR